MQIEKLPMLDFTFATVPELGREFATRLKTQRMRLGIAQPELAERAGVALGTVSSFEKNGKGTLETFLRLAAALGMIKELENVFLQSPTSIQELEDSMKPPRQRVARKPKEAS